MTTREQEPFGQLGRFDRRRMLWTGGAAAGAALLSAAPAARASEGQTLTLDMACDGRTLRLNRLNQAGAIGLPLVGDTFIVFGSVYPEGTIDRGLTGPDQPGAVGRWNCWGTFVVDIASEAAPHVITTVLFSLGEGISATGGQAGEAPDGLLTIGFEGGLPEVRRTLSGGYGRYAGARGVVVVAYRGENDTLLQLAPDVALPAPNFTFTFTFE